MPFLSRTEDPRSRFNGVQGPEVDLRHFVTNEAGDYVYPLDTVAKENPEIPLSSSGFAEPAGFKQRSMKDREKLAEKHFRIYAEKWESKAGRSLGKSLEFCKRKIWHCICWNDVFCSYADFDKCRDVLLRLHPTQAKEDSLAHLPEALAKVDLEKHLNIFSTEGINDDEADVYIAVWLIRKVSAGTIIDQLKNHIKACARRIGASVEASLMTAKPEATS